MKDSAKSLLLGRSRHCLFKSQKAFQLSLYCKAAQIRKKTITLFAEVKQLVQRLQSAVTEHCIIWDTITPIVALDSLHNNFKITTTLFLHSDNKNFKEI